MLSHSFDLMPDMYYTRNERLCLDPFQNDENGAEKYEAEFLFLTNFGVFGKVVTRGLTNYQRIRLYSLNHD